MARFEISTRTGFTGVGAGGVNFTNGRATITSDTESGKSALSYFASNQGYDILPLDEVTVSDALQRGNNSPTEDVKALQAEIDELKARRDIERLRKERDDLYREVYGHDRTDAPAAAQLTPGSKGEDVVEREGGKRPELVAADPSGQTVAPYVSPNDAPPAQDGKKLPPPADSAPVAEWRTWAVDSGRAKAEDVEKAPRSEIIAKHGAAFDAEREAELRGGGSTEGGASA